MPKFSMILPMHHCEKFARRMLDSIAAQDYKDYELICVCDACEDDSAGLARSYGARVEEVDFHRAGLSRNRGLEVATGEWLLFADDDDWLLHEFVFSQIADMAGKNGEDILVTVDDDDEFSDVADFFDDMLSDEADYDVNTNK